MTLRDNEWQFLLRWYELTKSQEVEKAVTAECKRLLANLCEANGTSEQSRRLKWLRGQVAKYPHIKELVDDLRGMEDSTCQES